MASVARRSPDDSAHRADYVVPLFSELHQARDFLGGILQIGIEGDDYVALALLESGHNGGVLTVVSIQDHRDERAVGAPGSPLEDVCRVVAAAIVDQHDFESVVELFAGRFSTAQQLWQALLFVVDRDDDRHELDGIRFQWLDSTVDSMAPTTRSTSSRVMSGNRGMEHSLDEFHSVSGRRTFGKRLR